MPLSKQELDDLKELLEKEMAKDEMPLHDHEKALLRQSLETNRMKVGAEMVCKALNKRNENRAAERLEDMVPLFDPHQFWESQPVPKLGEIDTLPDEAFNAPIEVKQVDQV